MKHPPTERPDSASSEALAGDASDGKRDVVLVQGVTEDRQGLKVLRARGAALEAGEIRPLREGQHLTSDVVRLHPRKGTPFICDVETTFSSREVPPGRPDPPNAFAQTVVRRGAGPAQVATQAYRENWDQIWSRRVSAPGSSDLN